MAVFSADIMACRLESASNASLRDREDGWVAGLCAARTALSAANCGAVKSDVSPSPAGVHVNGSPASPAAAHSSPKEGPIIFYPIISLATARAFRPPPKPMLFPSEPRNWIPYACDDVVLGLSYAKQTPEAPSVTVLPAVSGIIIANSLPIILVLLVVPRDIRANAASPATIQLNVGTPVATYIKFAAFVGVILIEVVARV